MCETPSPSLPSQYAPPQWPCHSPSAAASHPLPPQHLPLNSLPPPPRPLWRLQLLPHLRSIHGVRPQTLHFRMDSFRRLQFIPRQRPIKISPFLSFNHMSRGALIRAGICRFVAAASGIVAVYSFFELGVSAWEILRGTTPMPEIFQLWFDFGHDQGFAYLLLSATAAATVAAATVGVRKQWAAETCKRESGFCVQATISVAMAFVAFLFLACSALLSGFRLASYSITGSRFHL